MLEYSLLNTSISPDFEASVIANYLSKFSPSFIARFIQHLTEPPHNRLLQQADLHGPFQTIRHGGRLTMDVQVPKSQT